MVVQIRLGKDQAACVDLIVPLDTNLCCLTLLDISYPFDMDKDKETWHGLCHSPEQMSYSRREKTVFDAICTFQLDQSLECMCSSDRRLFSCKQLGRMNHTDVLVLFNKNGPIIQ